MARDTVVVLGGGTGGIVAARRLRRHLEGESRVVLVERDLTYRFAPSFLWVLTGARRPEQVTGDLRRLRRGGIEVVQAEVVAIDSEERRVTTSDGALAYDRLVIALGAELAPELLPGFAEAAHDVYTLDGAAAAGRALREFAGGRVVVLVSRLPYKCPAAPYETALLAEALLRRRGVRARSSVDVYTPEPFPMPTAGPAVGAALSQILEGREIGFHPGRAVERVDAQAEVVARRIAAELTGEVPSASFEGKGSCFVELGDGIAAYATGDFYAEAGPEVALRRPGRRWHLAKVALERYWLRRWF